MATKKSAARPVQVDAVRQENESEQNAAEKKTATRCVICGDEVAPFSTEELCWVCRRLKISAWRDSDPQALAQD